MESVLNDFPKWALLPKKETNVESFLLKYPNYDGRGIVIAIFDSGVDPLAPGLQLTSDGKPKVIERIDATGSGDVDTSKIVEVKEGCITGLSGRTLKIPDFWDNPTGKYHIGIKNCYELYPSKLKEKIIKEQKEKNWNPQFNNCFANALKSFEEHSVKNLGTLSFDQKLEKEDVEVKLEILNSFEKKYLDCGPSYDCIVFYDGNEWKACIDISQCGDLNSCQVIGPYSNTFQSATLTSDDQLTFSVNIHDEGNLLEIVTLCSAHGTHVASIAAAYFPDEPEKNGIAPGAQIVSVTIGDNRLSSMETGTAIVRAMIRAMNSFPFKIDVINMSYGEHAHWSHSGRIGEIVDEVVNKYGIIWIASAGNNGPALSTVGTPPNLRTNSIIGVGAYVSSEMMIAEYSLRDKSNGMPYTWSSRDPTPDGGCGVSICAPGGAITSVPKYLQRGSQLMNGTSMASPHVSGAVALILSGLKSSSITYSPFSIRRAIENTATQLAGVDYFTQGHGLLNVEKAFHYHTDLTSTVIKQVRFQVFCGQNCKGIYLRGNYGESQKVRDYSISIEPIFLNADSVDSQLKIDFNILLGLISDVEWLHHPKYLHLTYQQRFISIQLDPSALSPGYYFARINALDLSNPTQGQLFSIPVTVIIPEEVKKNRNIWRLCWNEKYFKTGQVRRHFINVPTGATWAVIKVSSKTPDIATKFCLHAVQMQSSSIIKTLEYYKIFGLIGHDESVHAFSVKSHLTLELALAKWWASLGISELCYCIQFHGVYPDVQDITIHLGEGVARVNVHCDLGPEEINPTLSLKNLVHVLRPSESHIHALSSRDIIPNGRHILELQLTYNFHVCKTGEISPNCDFLYESEYESQLWLLYDQNKRLLSAGDAYPYKVGKGDYVLRMHVRHEKKDMLDRLQDMTILLAQRLSTPISIDVYSSWSHAITGFKKFSSVITYPNQPCSIYILPSIHEKNLKGALPGHMLTGSISYAKDELGRKVNTYPVKLIITDPPKKSVHKGENKEKELHSKDEMNDLVRDLKISYLSKLDATASQDLYEELSQIYSDHLNLHITHLQQLNASNDISKAMKVIDLILSKIDSDKLLTYFGMKLDTNKNASKTKSEMEKLRNILVEAYAKQGVIFCNRYLETKDQESHSDIELNGKIEVCMREILKFVDMSDSKFVVLHALVREHFGRALKYLIKQQEEKNKPETEMQILKILKHLNWNFQYDLLWKSFLVRYPVGYQLF